MPQYEYQQVDLPLASGPDGTVDPRPAIDALNAHGAQGWRIALEVAKNICVPTTAPDGASVVGIAWRMILVREARPAEADREPKPNLGKKKD